MSDRETNTSSYSQSNNIPFNSVTSNPFNIPLFNRSIPNETQTLSRYIDILLLIEKEKTKQEEFKFKSDLERSKQYEFITRSIDNIYR
jgi:hypothetical protein